MQSAINAVLFLVLVLVKSGDLLWSCGAVTRNASTRPTVVSIGAAFNFSSIVGKVAKVAVQAAVEDVNSDPSVLGGTKLELTMEDTDYSGFGGIVEALRFMVSDTVAVIGHQRTAHVTALIANELQVPLLSYTATDPTLSPLQFPYFVRTSQNDLFQMAAVAEIVDYFGWRDVIAIYADDEHGRNGIAALGDKLEARRCGTYNKVPISPTATRNDMMDVLVKVALMESRIIVLHTGPINGSEIIKVAQSLGIMGTGYVWIATDWLSTIVETDFSVPSEELEMYQGVLTLRMYTPDSEFKRKLVSRWSNLTRTYSSDGTFGLSTYGLYAYDTVWLLARAINAFLDRGGVISFSNGSELTGRLGGLHLDGVSIFKGGKMLLDSILQVNTTGVTGPIEFTPDRDLIHPAYEVVNMIGPWYRRVGYWSNHSGLSIGLPETLYLQPANHSNSSQQLSPVIWPGLTTEKPRGWVFSKNGRDLNVAVTRRISYREIVSPVEGTADMFTGYCIDVFTSALKLLPYDVPYKFIPFGDGHSNPNCTRLLRMLTTGTFDAAVGDIAITTTRTKMADFTQPYIESGLVVVAAVKKSGSDNLAFLRPFTWQLWSLTVFFLVFVGAVVWTLEHRINDEFRGPPRKQVVTILWLGFSTLFSAHKENPVGTLGRAVLIVWLFAVFVISNSYTASLTSMLTVQQFSSPIKGIETLLANNDPIGYQRHSFTRNYLIDELRIHASRLVPLTTPEDYVKALKDGPKKGGVAAIVDERPYMELFLSTQCEFSVIGQEFANNGWGFAFPRNSPLAVDMSTAILKLSENGELQRIHDKWLTSSACASLETTFAVHRLPLRSFWGLFMGCGLVCLVALLVYFVQVVRQFIRYYSEETQSSDSSSRSSCLRTFLTFADKKEEEVIARSKRGKMESA